MPSIGPAPSLKPHEYVAELRAQHEIFERFDTIAAVTTDIHEKLTALSIWTTNEMARLNADEEECDRAEEKLADLGDRQYRAAERRHHEQIASKRKLIEEERAEVLRRKESIEAIYALQLLEELGIDRKLLPGLARKRSELVPGFAKLRVKIAVALSVLMAHDWPLDEAAKQIERELNDLGLNLPETWGSERGDRHGAPKKRALLLVERIIQCRRDVKIRDYKNMAKETAAQSWRDAFAALGALAAAPNPGENTRRAARDLSKWTMERPALPSLPTAPALAQSYFDRLARLTENGYAARRGDGLPAREAAREAARFALSLVDD